MTTLEARIAYMDSVPNPLRVGTPANRRTPSVEEVPTALRVGSPVVECGTSNPFAPTRPPLSHRSTSGSDRLSQLFPSRPPSLVSLRSEYDASRRTSYPSPLIPATDTAYQIPRAPAPPSFSENTSYDPSPDPFEEQRSPPVLHTSGTKRLINRLTSLRTSRSGSQGRYGLLEDEEDRKISGCRLKKVDEDDESVPFDLSGLDGNPIAMKSMGSTRIRMKNPTDEVETDHDLGGFAAEYERLEAQGAHGILGDGMSTVIEAPFVYQPESKQQHGHKRAVSDVDPSARKVAQKQAEKTGEILAVSEIPMDISDFNGGADFDSRSILTTNQADTDGSKTSYYFPPDPDMPAWRPMSMSWPYISFLIFIALALAILQEFLCQLSMRRTKNDDGLIKFKKPGDLSLTAFFTWKYSPVLTFVIYGILWQISDFEVKRLEPYYQLSRKSGATAAESLNMDYLTFMSWLVPLRALRHKQYAVIYSSLATLIAGSLVPVLQSASVTMYPDIKDRKDDEWKYVRIDPRWSRAVTACLLVVAICGTVLSYQLRRRSGLQSDPKGIAGIAAMATKSHILNDFQGLDTAPLDKIHKQLRHRRYILHKSSLWQGEYIRNSKEKIHETGTDPRPLMLRRLALAFYMGFIVAFAIFVPIVLFLPGANILTEKIPFLLTAIATGVKLMWGTMDSDIRMLEPFHILSRREAPPRTLTLDYTGTMPGWLSIKAFINRHFIVALVGNGAILTEILTVCVSSFSVDGKRFIQGQGHDEKSESDDRHNSEQTFRSFWISFALVFVILIYLLVIAIVVYLRRSHKFMPRQIGTMASVLAFIHQSKMLNTFIGTEKLNSSKMTEYLESIPKTYALGWFSGRDGEDHCGIDEEPLLASYEYGKDWTKTRMVGSEISSWQHL